MEQFNAEMSAQHYNSIKISIKIFLRNITQSIGDFRF